VRLSSPRPAFSGLSGAIRPAITPLSLLNADHLIGRVTSGGWLVASGDSGRAARRTDTPPLSATLEQLRSSALQEWLNDGTHCDALSSRRRTRQPCSP